MGTHPKVLIWDVEASDLKANFGYVFCIGYKWLDEKKIHLISIRDFAGSFRRDTTDDRAVLAKFLDVMAEADVQIAHYGSRFDVRFVNTRLMMHGMEPLRRVPIIDTWRLAKDHLCFHSNRLDAISRAIPVHRGSRKLKTPLEPEHWVRARAGDIKSLRYIEAHCIADIEVLEATYLELRRFSNNPPNLAKALDREGCPACGGERTQYRGYILTARGKRRQLQCRDCAHWFSAAMRK